MPPPPPIFFSHQARSFHVIQHTSPFEEPFLQQRDDYLQGILNLQLITRLGEPKATFSTGLD